jgi:signal peptidase I
MIANPGDWVDIDERGNVYVNNTRLDEPYLDDKAFGETNIELPYQVPDGKFFVMGDNRSVSIDSRNTSIGCVSEEQIVGKIVFRVWPLTQIGSIH